MNRSLLVFSILLILLGLGTGVYLLFIIGFLLIFPALIMSPKPGPQAPPTGSGQQPPRRVSPRPAPTTETASVPEPPPMAPVPPQMAAPTASVPAPPQMAPVPSQMGAPVSMPSIQTPYYSYSPSLFPTSIFPSVMQPMSVVQTLKEMRVEARESRESRDELVELGALFVLLKLAFG